jgi:nitrate reductase / nitrite oxidoreductase, alpha subunit
LGGRGLPARSAHRRARPQVLPTRPRRWQRISWDEAYHFAARALENIARTYSGEAGVRRLEAQGYDEAMIEAMQGAGTQTIKLRGGMAFLGATRIFGLYRFANMMALLDAKLRGVEPDEAHGARGWDSYSGTPTCLPAIRW